MSRLRKTYKSPTRKTHIIRGVTRRSVPVKKELPNVEELFPTYMSHDEYEKKYNAEMEEKNRLKKEIADKKAAERKARRPKVVKPKVKKRRKKKRVVKKPKRLPKVRETKEEKKVADEFGDSILRAVQRHFELKGKGPGTAEQLNRRYQYWTRHGFTWMEAYDMTQMYGAEVQKGNRSKKESLDTREELGRILTKVRNSRIQFIRKLQRAGITSAEAFNIIMFYDDRYRISIGKAGLNYLSTMIESIAYPVTLEHYRKSNLDTYHRLLGHAIETKLGIQMLAKRIKEIYYENDEEPPSLEEEGPFNAFRYGLYNEYKIRFSDM